MAIFVVRPSRGAWAFFGLVTLGVIASRASDRRQRTIERRDGPASEYAQNLAGCLYGDAAVFTFRTDDPPESLAALWRHRGGETMRGVLAGAPASWPGRCLPEMNSLVRRLERSATGRDGHALLSLARALEEDLRAGSNDRMMLTARVDGGLLGEQVAALLSGTRALSQGSLARWTTEYPNRWGPLPWNRAPRFRPWPDDLHRVSLAGPGALLARSLRGGVTRSFTLEPSGISTDTLGPAVAWTEGWGDGDEVARAASDDGGAVLRLGASPRMFPAPRVFAREGAAAGFDAQGVSAGDALMVLTRDAGTLRLRSAPLDGPVQWSPAVGVGPSESFVGALLLPDDRHDSVPRAVVVALRPSLGDGLLERYQVERTAAPEASLRVTGPTLIGTEVPLHGVRTLRCRAGSAGYLAALTDRVSTVVRVEGSGSAQRPVTAVWPLDRPASLHCDARRALVGVEGSSPSRMQWLTFPAHGAPTSTTLEPPGMGAAPTVYATRLVRGGAVAVAGSSTALRALRTRGPGARWEPGGMVLSLTPAPNARRTLTRVEVAAGGDVVTVRVEGYTTVTLPRPAGQQGPPPPPEVTGFHAVLQSADGGQTFTAAM